MLSCPDFQIANWTPGLSRRHALFRGSITVSGWNARFETQVGGPRSFVALIYKACLSGVFARLRSALTVVRDYRRF